MDIRDERFCLRSNGEKACFRPPKAGLDRSGRPYEYCDVHQKTPKARPDLRTPGVPTRSTHSEGYITLHLPNHPLAGANGSVLEHRAVLYDSIGYGRHACYKCGRIVRWELTWPTGGLASLVVDHENGVRTDNRLSNLRPACQPCNANFEPDPVAEANKIVDAADLSAFWADLRSDVGNES